MIYFVKLKTQNVCKPIRNTSNYNIREMLNIKNKKYI